MSIEELHDKLACADVLTDFADALDRGANSEAADLFTEDGILRRPGELDVSGPAARRVMEARPSHVVTRHMLTNVRVKVIDASTAEAKAYLLIYRVPREPEALPRPMPATPQAIGEGRFELRRTPDGWRISLYEAIAVMAPASA